jgi:hypothetical protein
MNWEAIGAIGEILGAIAVLVTLIYLANQIKQHTLATRAVTNSAYAEAGRELNLAIANSPELVRAMANWPENPADVAPEDQFLVLSFWRAVFHIWANVYRQYRDGALDSAIMTALRKEISTYSMGASDNPALISRARMLEFAWSVERFIFEPSFQQFVDDLLANPD